MDKNNNIVLVYEIVCIWENGEYPNRREYYHNIETCHNEILSRIHDRIVRYDRNKIHYLDDVAKKLDKFRDPDKDKIVNSERINDLIYSLCDYFNKMVLAKKVHSEYGDILDSNKNPEFIDAIETYNYILRVIYTYLEEKTYLKIAVNDDLWNEKYDSAFSPNDYHYRHNSFQLYYPSHNFNGDKNKPIASFHMHVDNIRYAGKIYGRTTSGQLIWVDYYREKDQDEIDQYYRKLTLIDGIDKIYENKNKINFINKHLQDKKVTDSVSYDSLLGAYLNSNFEIFTKDMDNELMVLPNDTKLLLEPIYTNWFGTETDGTNDLMLKAVVIEGKSETDIREIASITI